MFSVILLLLFHFSNLAVYLAEGRQDIEPYYMPFIRSHLSSTWKKTPEVHSDFQWRDFVCVGGSWISQSGDSFNLWAKMCLLLEKVVTAPQHIIMLNSCCLEQLRQAGDRPVD